LNGRRLGLPALIAELNQLAGQAGVGRIDMVENRLVGIKSREVYEAPAAVTLMTSARSLEQLVLTRELGRLKMSLEHPYATLAYEGLWYSPARDALDAFMTEATKAVSGEVTVALDHGQATVVSRTAPQTLYQPRLATYGDDDQFDHKSAEGFVTLWGLPIRTLARVAPVAPASLDELPVTVSEAHQHA
jgi:argininosuccinate synthase